MKRITTLTPIAAAIALAFGTGIASAQDDNAEQAQSRIEQQADRAGAEIEQQADRVESAVADGPADAREAIDRRADQAQSQQGQPDQLPASDRANQRAEERANASGMSIDQIATRNADLSTFVDAVKAAGLEDSLTDGTNYTLFAPTNEAFEGQDLESLMEPDNRDELVALLRAHIVADDLDRELAGTIEQAQTIDGGTVDVSVDGEKLMIGDTEASLDSGMQFGQLRIYAVDGVLEAQAMPAEDPRAALRSGQQ